MENCKLQIGCMIIITYIALVYIREQRWYKVNKKNPMFNGLLIMGTISILFDGLTAYTVNHLQQVNDVLNRLLHMCFLLSLDVLVFMVFLYMLNISEGIPKKNTSRIIIFLPLLINIVTVIIFMPQLSYRQGVNSNYSMGISAYTCFIMAGIYIFMAIFIFLRNWNYIEKYKQVSIFTYLAAMIAVTCYQMIFPEALITSIVPTIIIIGAYMNQENPAFTNLEKYHDEMVMGFATLVENRDDNTGGHIKRTTAYVKLLSKELKKQGLYREELTKDYIKNLVMAAPMHDIGKIAIPDSILQKPGKLTEEEFQIMKTHSSRGGKIVRDTFGHLGDEQYVKIAYDVARFHHEKWNGKGYPDGLANKDIPLCARIMAIADVFDAVSAKRCYRDALPLDTCFNIIVEGRGQDFDPIIAEVFVNIREDVEKVFNRQQ